MKPPPFPHACDQVIRQGFADLDVEVVVSTQPPLVDGPYTMPPHTCPHGTAYFAEPTGEQIAQWVKDGVK
jgi:hypothetical protein